MVFPRASWTACAIRRGDEPDEPELRCEAGRLRGATRGPADPVSQRPAQRRRDGRASAQITTPGRRGLYRQGAGEDAGVPHREAHEPEDRAALSLDRAFDRDGQSLLRLRVRPRFRAVLPQILQLLSVQCQAVPERSRIRQMPTRPARHCVRGARQWRPELRRPRTPAEDLRLPPGPKDLYLATQVAYLAPHTVYL